MLLLLGISLAVPARAADKETLQMMADIRMLQEQTQQSRWCWHSRTWGSHPRDRPQPIASINR